MPNFNIEVEVEIFCEECGAGLCNQSTGGNSKNRNQFSVQVSPCEKCMQKEYDKGFRVGGAT